MSYMIKRLQKEFSFLLFSKGTFWRFFKISNAFKWKSSTVCSIIFLGISLDIVIPYRWIFNGSSVKYWHGYVAKLESQNERETKSGFPTHIFLLLCARSLSFIICTQFLLRFKGIVCTSSEDMIILSWQILIILFTEVKEFYLLSLLYLFNLFFSFSFYPRSKLQQLRSSCKSICNTIVVDSLRF